MHQSSKCRFGILVEFPLHEYLFSDDWAPGSWDIRVIRKADMSFFAENVQIRRGGFGVVPPLSTIHQVSLKSKSAWLKLSFFLWFGMEQKKKPIDDQRTHFLLSTLVSSQIIIPFVLFVSSYVSGTVWNIIVILIHQLEMFACTSLMGDIFHRSFGEGLLLVAMDKKCSKRYVEEQSSCRLLQSKSFFWPIFYFLLSHKNILQNGNFFLTPPQNTQIK